MLLNYKKKYLDVLSTESFPLPVSMNTYILIPYYPYDDENQFGFKRHRKSH